MVYLVQLLYPDNLTADYGVDHFAWDVETTAEVEALPDNERLAWIVASARTAAVEANPGTPPADFRLFAVLYCAHGVVEYAADATTGL